MPRHPLSNVKLCLLHKYIRQLYHEVSPQIFDGSQQTLMPSNSSRTTQNHGYQRV
eukprot:UN23716